MSIIKQFNITQSIEWCTKALRNEFIPNNWWKIFQILSHISLIYKD